MACGSSINLPVVVTTALSASLVPAISEAMALKNGKMVATRAETGIRMSLIFGLPAAAGMFVLAEPIMVLLYKNAEAGICLEYLSWGVVFLALTQTTTGILQGIGKTLIPVRNMVIGAVIKVAVNYYLTGIPNINIKGAALGTVIGYLVPAMLNFSAVAHWSDLVVDLNQMILKPVFATAIMGASVAIGYGELVTFGFTQDKATLISIVLGILVYAIMLLITGCLKKSDLELLPGGKRLATFLTNLEV